MTVATFFDTMAQVPGVEKDAARILITCTILLMTLILAAVVFAVLQRRRRRQSKDSGPVWTLNDLRDMHARGDLSQAEYLKLREVLIATIGGQAGDSDSLKRRRTEQDDLEVVWEAGDASPPEKGPDDGGSPDFDLKKGSRP